VPVAAAARVDRSCDKAQSQWNNGSDSRHDHHRQIIAVEQVCMTRWATRER
jgi:hypothetical protein